MIISQFKVSKYIALTNPSKYKNLFLRNLKKKKNNFMALFMDGVQLPQGLSHFEEAVYKHTLKLQTLKQQKLKNADTATCKVGLPQNKQSKLQRKNN